MSRALFLLATAAFATLAAAHGVRASDDAMPSARVQIYPGDIIRDDLLTDIPVRNDPFGPYARERAEVIGKAARLTLLPGRPIPLRGVDSPRLVVNGSEVKLVYIDGGLSIMTTGAALQDGTVGEMVKVRNTDSGVTIVGKVMPDGTVRVGGG
jgi:flagella basal body P-ring formation protein FlgA